MEIERDFLMPSAAPNNGFSPKVPGRGFHAFTIEGVSIAPLLRRLAPQYGIDPAAAIAVALGEGGLVNRENDIGDLAGGGSYGPFQLYAKGALPRQYVGNAALADRWAWSPEGIKYALSRMKAAGASGLRGPAAVEMIIRRFERPADPNKSVAAALARLGTGGVAQRTEQGGASNSFAQAFKPEVAGSMPAAPIQNRRDFILQGLIAGRNPNDLIQALPGMRRREAVVAGPSPNPASRASTPAMSQTSTGKDIRELIYDPMGSVFDGVASKEPYGGHPNHVHYAGRTPQQMLQAIALARNLGLSVRENPYTDPVDPVHTKNSLHYGNFPGVYNDRKLGRAADISGDPNKLRTLYLRLAGLR